MAVYLIQAGDGGPIKIGYAQNVRHRLSSLRIGSPVDLRVIGIVPDGTRDLELKLHGKFANARLRGEWFMPSPELLAFALELEQLKAPNSRRGIRANGPRGEQLSQARLARLLRLSPAGISHAVARGDLRIVAIQAAWRLMTDEMRQRWIEQLQAEPHEEPIQ